MLKLQSAPGKLAFANPPCRTPGNPACSSENPGARTAVTRGKSAGPFGGLTKLDAVVIRTRRKCWNSFDEGPPQALGLRQALPLWIGKRFAGRCRVQSRAVMLTAVPEPAAAARGKIIAPPLSWKERFRIKTEMTGTNDTTGTVRLGPRPRQLLGKAEAGCRSSFCHLTAHANGCPPLYAASPPSLSFSPSGPVRVSLTATHNHL